jgi:hypothetical protein
MPVKEELDRAVPPHELLDNSAFKSRVELVKGGSLAGRQLPTPSKKSPVHSSSSVSISVASFNKTNLTLSLILRTPIKSITFTILLYFLLTLVRKVRRSKADTFSVNLSKCLLFF